MPVSIEIKMYFSIVNFCYFALHRASARFFNLIIGCDCKKNKVRCSMLFDLSSNNGLRHDAAENPEGRTKTWTTNRKINKNKRIDRECSFNINSFMILEPKSGAIQLDFRSYQARRCEPESQAVHAIRSFPFTNLRPAWRFKINTIARS